MSATEVHNANGDATVGRADMHLEGEIIPVCDVDGAKEFYERLGFSLDDVVAPAGGPSHRPVHTQGSGTATAAVRRAGQRSHD